MEQRPKIRWRNLVAQGAVIIGSILAAFAVDAWWAAALNADKEREHPGYREDRTGKVLRTQTGPA